MNISKQAIKLASEILSQPEFASLRPLNQSCKATDRQKRKEICLLPRNSARLETCKSCKYYK